MDFLENLKVVFLLVIPLLWGGILHMIAVKKNVFPYLKKPVHLKSFGANKTWRGFIMMPLATLPGILIAKQLEFVVEPRAQIFQGQSTVFMAICLGLAYCLAELPNSFMKRRLGISEGKTSDEFKWFFVVIDQADSVFGCLVAYKLLVGISWEQFWMTVVLGTLVHLAFNVLLYKLRVRKNPY